MASNKKQNPHFDPQRVKPIGMLRYAIEYYAMAIIAERELGKEVGHVTVAPAPVNFALGLAIELGLKAFLLQTGTSLEDIKKEIGHDLEACMRKAKAAGLGEYLVLYKVDDEVVSILNSLYASRELEYIVTGLKVAPKFNPLQSFSKWLLLSVVKAVPQASGLLHSRAGKVLRPEQETEAILLDAD